MKDRVGAEFEVGNFVGYGVGNVGVVTAITEKKIRIRGFFQSWQDVWVCSVKDSWISYPHLTFVIHKVCDPALLAVVEDWRQKHWVTA